MAKFPASRSDAHSALQFLHGRGLTHLRVRARGDLLTIESGDETEPVRHARLRHVTVQYWTLDMATHTGRWESTPYRGVMDEILSLLVDTFGWVLAPIE